MFSSFLLSLREGLEAALVIGIVLAALNKFQRRDLHPAVWSGVLAAVLLSLGAALLLIRLSISFEGKFEQLFEGFAMLSAAALLTWMILWMRGHASSLQTEMEARTASALSARDRTAIFFLVFFAVFREGLELALFLLAARMAENAQYQLVGVLLGLASSAALGLVFFVFARGLGLRRFFQFTNVLLILFAAGLVGLAIHEFNEAGWIPALVEHVWDLSPILSEESSLGGILKALFGYQADPSLASVLGYIGFLLVMLWRLDWFKHKKNDQVKGSY
jgi:high-affinity iron transporter